jgi:hypothetical protein
MFLRACRWRVFSKEECPVRCGQGMRRQLVHCVKQTGYSQAEIIRDKDCRKFLGAKPDEYVPCTGRCLPTYWSYTKWSDVSIFLLLYFFKTLYFYVVHVSLKCNLGLLHLFGDFCTSLVILNFVSIHFFSLFSMSMSQTIQPWSVQNAYSFP